MFGFVSAGMMLGSAVMPVPYGLLIDAGRPKLVLVLAAGLSVVSLAFARNVCKNRSKSAPISVESDT